MSLRSLVLLIASVVVPACGATVSPDGSTEGGTDVVTIDATGTDVMAIDASVAPCPSMEPTSNQTCTHEGVVCTYGNDPLFTCRDRATCMGGAWTVTVVDCSGAGMCPMTPPSGACTLNSTVCPYVDGTRCICTQCAGGPCTMNAAWLCVPPPSDTRCPRISPQLGETCSVDALECDYGACAQGWKLRCTGGVWVSESVPCPR